MDSSVSAPHHSNGVDLELRAVALESPLNRSLARDPDSPAEEVTIPVSGGRCRLTVARCGQEGRPVILTYHDLGLNYVSNFQVGSRRRRRRRRTGWRDSGPTNTSAFSDGFS